MNLLKQLLGIAVIACVAVVLLYFAVTVFVIGLVVFALATIWYSIRFYFLRKNINEALREYHDTSFSDAYRRNDDAAIEGEVIEAEYVEVDNNEKDRNPPSSTAG